MTLLNSAVDFIYRNANLENIAVTAFLVCIIYYFLYCRDLPPGPWGIPVLGYWPFLQSTDGHLHLKKLREKYGEIFSFTGAGKLVVSLSSMKAIKEARLNKSDFFEDRWTEYSLISVSLAGGVTVLNGEAWKVQRKFFTQKFKEYGMLAAKQDISGAFHDAVNQTMNEIRILDGKPVVINDLLTTKCCFILRRILFNDHGISEEELKELNHEYGYVLEAMTYKNMILMGTIARYIVFPFLPSYWAMMRSHYRIHAIVKNIIQRHKLTFDESHATNVIDSFYKEKKERQKKGDPSAAYFTDQALISAIYQFVTDGVLSVAFFISVVLQHLVDYPEEQNKIYNEVIEVVGHDRQPTIEDKSNLPYTNAFIYEVVRFTDAFPLFPFAQCTRETTLGGYRIPKRAVMVMNTWSAHHDPDLYEDPFTFNPSRFITTTGKQRPDLPILFGVGKRACIGEPFTMTQTFLFLTTIIKDYRLTYPNKGSKTTNTLSKTELKICAIPRNQENLKR